MFVIGLAVFGMASLVAAYAPSPLLLIGGRALLAVGAAMMMPATLSIIRLTFSDERERAMAIGLWARWPPAARRSGLWSAACCSNISGGARSS
jgi:MFS family permease